MKLTKSLMLVALAAGGLLAGNLALQAQNATNRPAAGAPRGLHGGMRPAGPTLEQLTKALDLTDDQKAKVKPILEARNKKINAARNSGLSRDELRAKFQSIHKETNKALKAVLTEEQFEKYLQITQHGGHKRPAKPARN